MKTIEMMTLRNITLRTLSGHSVKFVKQVPTNVPDMCVDEAMAIGAVPIEPKDIEPEETKFTPEPVGLEREEAILTAIEMLVEENARNKFTAGGKPTKSAMRDALGFELDNREINLMWSKYKESEE